jgi:hypothetical protein
MSKRAKKTRRAAKRGGSATKKSGPVDLEPVRQRIIRHVANNAFLMAKASTDDCKKSGSISTLKYLFESVGLFPCPPDQQSGDSELTLRLLERLGPPEEEAGEPEEDAAQPELEAAPMDADAAQSEPNPDSETKIEADGADAVE